MAEQKVLKVKISKRLLIILLLSVLIIGYILFPKTCATNGHWSFSCECTGYETDVAYDFKGSYGEGDKQSYCIGIRTERWQLE